MHSHKQWRDGKAARSAIARRAAEARWGKREAGPVRVDRVIEIVIRDSRHTQRTIRAVAEDQGERLGRWKVWENGVASRRRWTGRGLGLAIGRTL